MKGPAKLTEDVSLRITYEMARWLDGVCAESGCKHRGEMIRSLLQTIMIEDMAAHDDGGTKLEIVSSRPA